jgi:hypothetical protein
MDDSEARKALKELKVSVPEVGKAASNAALKELVERMAERVRDMIPDKGGWYDIYRKGVVTIKHGPDDYELAVDTTEMSFGDIEADSTLIWIGGGGDEIAAILSTENPWTLDTIPAIPGGFQADLTVRPASESEIDFYRSRHLANRPTLESAIGALGKQIYPLDAQLPVVNGRTMADVQFLATRLEFGLGGFPRTPIWSKMQAEQEKILRSKQIQDAADNAAAAEWHRRTR